MSPPFLDVSDTLLDPDFCDTSLQCLRSSVSANTQGIGVKTSPQTIGFGGVVTSDRGELLERVAVGEYASGSILVITRFVLRDAGPNATADIVVWNGKQYTVTKVYPYSTYGRGFIEAICELVPLAG